MSDYLPRIKTENGGPYTEGGRLVRKRGGNPCATDGVPQTIFASSTTWSAPSAIRVARDVCRPNKGSEHGNVSSHWHRESKSVSGATGVSTDSRKQSQQLRCSW